MFDFGQIVLVIFIIIRLMIAFGLLYLIIYEIKRNRKKRKGKDENVNGEDTDGTDNRGE